MRSRFPRSLPVGAFGHSQGGWVVYEAAAPGAGLDFIVANSGPGVSPAVQERYSVATRVADAEPDSASAALGLFDDVCEVAVQGSSLDVFRRVLDSGEASDAAQLLGAVPDAEDWSLLSAIFRYDPAPALRAIAVPVLAIFGGRDSLVPVEASCEALARLVNPALLTVVVLDVGDHRLQDSEGDLAPAYRERLRDFLSAVTAA